MLMLVMLAGILLCYGCGPSAGIAADILTHGNHRAMREAFIAGTEVDLVAGSVALNRLAAAQQPQPVVVVEQEQPPEQAEAEFVEPVIVYNEPCYLPCPIVVGFPYEYYTYENVDGFVNIVFWQGGHRFRHEEWRYHGERMRADRMHEWARSHKVSRGMMERHRDQLAQRHNIRHDDAHFGLNKSSTHAQKNMRQQAQRPNESPRAAQQRAQQQKPQQQRAQQQRPQQQRPQQAVQQRAPQQRQQQAVQQRPQQKPQQAAQKKKPNQQ